MYKTLAASAAGIFVSLILVRALERQEQLSTTVGSGTITISYGQIANLAVWGVLFFATMKRRDLLSAFTGAGFAAAIAIIPADWVANYRALPPTETD